MVLSPEQDANQRLRWRGRLLPASEWQAASVKVFNASSEPLGISAGRKQLQLAHGKTMDFHASEWKDAFPVKIFHPHPGAHPPAGHRTRLGQGGGKIPAVDT